MGISAHDGRMTTHDDDDDGFDAMTAAINDLMDRFGPLGLAGIVADGEGSVTVIVAAASGGYYAYDLESGEGHYAGTVPFAEAVKDTVAFA